MTDLRQVWLTTLRAAGATGAPAVLARAGNDLLRRWDHPSRQYHDVEHLADVLAAVDRLVAGPSGPQGGQEPDLAAVRLAAWFHDAVYEGRPGDDEEASARLAESVLADLGVPDPRVRRVAELVRMTAAHRPDDGDVEAALLCDADLAVLGSDGERYRRYAAAIRAEYAHVPDAAFRAGRAAVLRALVEQPQLYRTAAARTEWEELARANVARELAELTSEPPT